MANFLEGLNRMMKDPMTMMGANLLANQYEKGGVGKGLLAGMQQQQAMKKAQQAAQYQKSQTDYLKLLMMSKQKEGQREQQKLDLYERPWTPGKTKGGQHYMTHPLHGAKYGARPTGLGGIPGLDGLIPEPTEEEIKKKMAENEKGAWYNPFGGNFLGGAPEAFSDWSKSGANPLRDTGSNLAAALPQLQKASQQRRDQSILGGGQSSGNILRGGGAGLKAAANKMNVHMQAMLRVQRGDFNDIEAMSKEDLFEHMTSYGQKYSKKAYETIRDIYDRK